MKIKTKTFNPDKYFLMNQFVQRTVLMLFGFLLIGQVAVGLSESTSNEFSIGRYHKGIDTIQLDKSFGSFQNSPFNSDSKLPETSGETEVEECIDDELSGGNPATSLQVSILRSGTGRLTSDFLKSLQNRKAIPLFILHHCWRIFLC